MFSSSVLLKLLILAFTWGKLDAQAPKLNLPAADVFDLRYPLIIDGNGASSHSRRAFGFSVALSAGPAQSTEGSFKTGWIFIGDPLDDPIAHDVNETGAMWRCSLGKRSDFCQKVDIDPKHVATNNKRDQASPSLEDEGGTFVGGDIQVKNGRLVTCGHRYTRGGKSYMNGICYFLPDSLAGPQAERSHHKVPIIPTLFSGNYSHRLLPLMALSNNGKGLQPLAENTFNFTHNGNSDVGNEWGLGQVGISIELLKNSSNGQELLLGAPGVRMWSGAVVRYSDNPTKSFAQNLRLNKFKDDPSFVEMVVAYRGSLDFRQNNHWHDYFGYEVSSGRYFNKSEVLYSAGAPRAADLTGEVVIFSIPNAKLPPMDLVKRDIEVKAEIRPTPQAFGSYFGSVLLSVDLDGDGRDELLVGAPMFTATKRKPVKRSADIFMKDPNEINFSAVDDKSNEPEWMGDHGCVFVYWFHENSSVAKQQNLTGGDSPIPGGRFGSAISFLNFRRQDSSPELFIVVGAPYERDNRGAIYLFKMDRTANELKFSHKITSEEASGGAVIYGFGNSLSLSVDIDGNDTPDLAIGAFKSNSVIVLRSRPRIKLLGTLKGSVSRDVTHEGQVYSFVICTNYTRDTGIFSPTLEIWTEIEVDIPLSIEEIRGKLFNRDIISGSEKLSKDKRRLVYKSKSDGVCQRISTFLNSTVMVTENGVLPLPITISQTLWFNQMEDSTVKPVTYEISSEQLHPVRKSSSFNFTSFEDNKPFPVPPTVFYHPFEVTPSACNNPLKCEPELDLDYKWYDANDTDLTNPLKSYTIGTFDVVLLLNISNNREGETAHKPRYEFRWDRETIVLAEDKINNDWIDECQRETNGIKFNCTLLRNVMKNFTVARKLKFDMSKLYARKIPDSFTVYFKFIDNNGKVVYKDATLPLKIVDETSVRIIGSRMSDTLKNAFIYNCTKLHFPRDSDSSARDKNAEEIKLYSKFRQTYRITLSGTRVEKVKIKVKLPWGYSKSEEDKSLLLIEQPVGKSNVVCDVIDHSYFYNIRSPGEASRDNSEEQESNIFSTVANRRKRQVGGESSSGHDSSISQDGDKISDNTDKMDATSGFRVKQDDQEVQESTLYIHCNDSSPTGWKWKCFELTCTVHGVSSYEEIHFDMFFVQESIDQLMEQLGKTQVLVESSGYAEIEFSESHNSPRFAHKDIAQTKLEKVFGEVEIWVYLVAVLCGILLLLLLVLILYKCGFFKREQKAKLDGMKREIARKSSMFPPNLRSGSYMEMIDQLDDDPEPPVQTKKNSIGEIVEHM